MKRGYWSMIAQAKDLDGYQQRKFTYDVSSWGELTRDGWAKEYPAIWTIWPGQAPNIRDGNHRLQAAIENTPELLVPVLIVCQRKLWEEIYGKTTKGQWNWNEHSTERR